MTIEETVSVIFLSCICGVAFYTVGLFVFTIRNKRLLKKLEKQLERWVDEDELP